MPGQQPGVPGTPGHPGGSQNFYRLLAETRKGQSTPDPGSGLKKI